jgi:flagellar hook protein FlgE
MSFYTALTGLNGSSADISATSNNIANVGTTGFKRSRVEFGDIFATSPLQNASSSIGSGTILKGIKQQFTQGNIAASLNALDLAISGQGFFALKPSLTSAQTVYTRNGSLNVNNDRYVVDSAGQYLLTYPVNTDGSVTAKDLDSAVPLQLPVTSGDPQATSNIKLGVNVNAASDVVPDRPQFQDGYSFDPNDPETFTNSTSITIFDDLGNPTIATVYFIKTQAASADDPTNKYDTRLVINDTIITPDLVSAVDDAGKQIFVDRFGQQTTSIPDDNYFIEGKGSPLYKLDDLQTLVPSQPAKLNGEQTSFDFGEEGDKLVEIVTDPMQFKATREAGNTGSDVYWGKDFLLVNVDDSDQPVSIDINPGLYNADQLAAEVERAINAAYGDDRKFQVEQNVDDTITFDFQRVGADGAITPLTNKVSVELLGTDSYVTEAMGDDFAITGTSPDFTKEEFLAHTQIRINETLNEYGRQYSDDPLGVGGLQFTKSTGEAIANVYEYTQVVVLDRVDDPADKHYMVHSYANKQPSLGVHTVLDGVGGNGSNLIEYASTENRLRIYLDANADPTDYEQGRSITLAGDDDFRGDLNGRSFVVSSTGSTTVNGTTYNYVDVSTSGLAVADEDFNIAASGGPTIFALTSPADDEPTVEAFFEGSHPVYEGAQEDYSSQSIIIREKQGSTATTQKGAFVASDWKIQNGAESAVTNAATLATNLSLLGLQNLHRPMEITASAGSANSTTLTWSDGTNSLAITTAAHTNASAAVQLDDIRDKLDALTDLKGFSFTFLDSNGAVIDSTGGSNWRDTSSITTNAGGTIDKIIVSRDDNVDFNVVAGGATSLTSSVDGGATPNAVNANAVTSTVLAKSAVDWVDEKNPPVKVGYDAVNQRLSFEVDRTVLGSGTDSNFNSFSVYGSATQTGVNNLGLTNADNAGRVQIRGGEVLYGDPFVATGEEIQPNDKRYGIKVAYNSELQNFSISSGTTGEAIDGNGAIGVSEQQKASNIQVGRYAISETTGARVAQAYDVDATIIGNGDNSLFGVGKTKNDFLFSAGTGLKATSAQAVGASANEPLTNVFKLSTQNGDNIFNVSVNGISGIIEVPATSYVGTTLAEALQTRINQIVDPATGDTIGGVTVSYSSETNSFTFATGTTGTDSTIKVKGAARLGLDDVPLGVGTVPEIYNLVQATDAQGVALYVDANGEVVTNPPENMVEDYYPLYIDEGELTFDKTGKLVSPKNLVHYEKQEEGFSIALDVDFSSSTQLAQPFSVLTVEQDGFTSGRLDGIEIDSSGTIRANYTNGQNNPLGKIVVANFNNQNGLKQIGNATYTETAVSGTPQVGEAGSEGFGNILSGSLERSNVDITEELVNLITAQRNFQASAKAIETTTGLTQTIINIRM